MPHGFVRHVRDLRPVAGIDQHHAAFGRTLRSRGGAFGGAGRRFVRVLIHQPTSQRLMKRHGGGAAQHQPERLQIAIARRAAQQGRKIGGIDLGQRAQPALRQPA